MKPRQFKKRTEIPEKYKWDLDYLLGGKTIEELIEKFEIRARELIKVKEKKYESKESFLKALIKSEKNTKLLFKISNYISNSINQDIVDPKVNALAEKTNFMMYNLAQEEGAELPRILKHEKQIKKWIKEVKFVSFKKKFERIFEDKKHTPSKEIQEYRILASRGDVDATNIFEIITDSELDYGFAISSKGKKTKITSANRIKLSKSNDAKVRKTSAISYAKGYLKHKESLSNLLFQHFKLGVTEAKIHKFNNVIDSLVYSDRGSEKLLHSLYNSVQNNLDIFKEAREIQSKSYKAKFNEKMTRFDLARDIVKVKTEYTIEESQKLVLDALKPFGKEYTDVVKIAFSERWIDYMTIDNKRSGAYSIGQTYDIDKKYILMNHDGTLRAVETLAHEVGHSMHSYFSDKHNTLEESQYTIFVAEIASIFNELMLFDHILKNTTNNKLKFQIRKQMADGFSGTVLKQIMWSNYEYDLYKEIEAGRPASTYEAISKIYFNNSKKYSLKSNIKYKANDQWAAIMVPHFYYDFYVYKYAIGQMVANIFFQKYKEQGKPAIEHYIKMFLSVGGKDDPIVMLKKAGVDLEDPMTYEIGFKLARENVKELNTLAKKIFKIK